MLPIELQNGKKVQAYPLTSAQQLMLYLSKQYGNNVPVLNICTGYYWQGEFDTGIMKESLNEAIERCNAMRIRFAAHPLFKVVQYLADESEIEIIEEDLSSMPWDDAHEFIKERSHSLIELFEKPVNEVRIIHFENDYHGVYVKLHHMAFDGYSSRIFLCDAVEIYLSKKYNMPYPKPMKSYIECIEKEFRYKDSEQQEKDIEFWKGTILDYPEAIYTDYVRPSRLLKKREEANDPSLRRVEVHDGNDPSSKTLKFSIDSETTQKIMKMCAENDLSVPCVLMMGLRSALSSFNNDEKDISYKVMINRRATLLEKKSGGMRMHFFSMRSIVESEMTFIQAVRVLEKAQNDIFIHSNISTIEAIVIRHQAMQCGSDATYESMSFSYLPQLEIPCYGEQMKKTCRGFWYNNDVSMQNLYLTVMHRSYDGGLDFVFEYRTNNNPIGELNIFYRKMIDSILLGVDNPDITVKEILDDIREDKV